MLRDFANQGAENKSDIKAKPFQLAPIEFKQIPGWKADSHSDIIPVFLKSCKSFLARPGEAQVGRRPEMGTVKDWAEICNAVPMIKAGSDVEARYFIESRFQAYAFGNKRSSRGLFTGYYEPLLRGSFQPDSRYKVPLLSKPKDLFYADLSKFKKELTGEKITGRLRANQLIPYFSREEIEKGALKGNQLEILWVDSEIDAFFLHIQGSGRILLPDGTSVRVGFAGKNGHLYTSVGRELVGMGVMKLSEVNMPVIRLWMEQNPLAARALMNKNKSYIFFRVLDTAGPIGSSGSVLTPGRSIAVDPRYTPYGSLVWLSTDFPGEKPRRPLRRLLVAQDTGSAIKGVVRGDVFWGEGPDAERRAGLMKSKGTLFILLPKNAALAPVQ